MRRAAESCVSFHEVDLRGGAGGELAKYSAGTCPACGDFFLMFGLFSVVFFVVFLFCFLIVLGSFWGRFGVPFWSHFGAMLASFFVLVLVLFSCCFLFVFGSFWGAIWGRFWSPNWVKIRTCDFLIFIDFP